MTFIDLFQRCIRRVSATREARFSALRPLACGMTAAMLAGAAAPAAAELPVLLASARVAGLDLSHAGQPDLGMPAVAAPRRGPVDTAAVAGRVVPKAESTTLDHLAAEDAGALKALSRGLSYAAAPTRHGPSRALSWARIEGSQSAGGPQWRCLTEALYFEARGESLAGIVAVGEVILNRVESRAYPRSVCGVVEQGAGKRLHACQFSYMCDGQPERIAEPEAWDRVGRVARALLDRSLPVTLTQGATHYHTFRVKPGWARRLLRTAEIGDHLFYRYPDALASN